MTIRRAGQCHEPQLVVGIDRHRVADDGQHGLVAHRVGIGVALGKVVAVVGRQTADDLRAALADAGIVEDARIPLQLHVARLEGEERRLAGGRIGVAILGIIRNIIQRAELIPHRQGEFHLVLPGGQIVEAIGAAAVGGRNALGLSGPVEQFNSCLLYTSPSPRDRTRSRMPSSA